MPNTQNDQSQNTSTQQSQPDYEAILKKVEEKVWRLWLEELRRNNERRNGFRS